MIGVIITICAFGVIVSLLLEKNIYNPLFVFSIIWLVIFMLCLINPYDLPEVSEDSLVTMLVGIGSFVVGAAVLGNIKITRKGILLKAANSKNLIKTYENDFIKHKTLIFCVQLFGLLIYLYLGFGGIKAILTGNSLSFIRYYLRLETLDSNFKGILISYVAAPILYFSITYSAANMAIHNINRGTILSVIMTVFMLVLDLLTVGGRMGILFSLVAVFVCFFVYEKQNKQWNSKGKLGFILIIIAIFGIYTIWTMSANRGNKALESLCVYLYAPVSCFDAYRDIFLHDKYSYTLGLLSSQGFTRPLFKLLGLSNISIIKNVDMAYKLIDSEVWLNLHRFNSETTYIGYFFFDGGNLTVCLFSLLFGFVSQKYYYKSIQRETMKASSLCLYIMMLGTVALSFMQFSFSAIGFALSIIWIKVLSSKYVFR